jgi:hypothetical protein
MRSNPWAKASAGPDIVRRFSHPLSAHFPDRQDQTPLAIDLPTFASHPIVFQRHTSRQQTAVLLITQDGWASPTWTAREISRRKVSSFHWIFDEDHLPPRVLNRTCINNMSIRLTSSEILNTWLLWPLPLPSTNWWVDKMGFNGSFYYEALTRISPRWSFKAATGGMFVCPGWSVVHGFCCISKPLFDLKPHIYVVCQIPVVVR